jgi:hypothetical protein
MADDEKDHDVTAEEHHSKAKGAVIGAVIGAEHQHRKNEDEKD